MMRKKMCFLHEFMANVRNEVRTKSVQKKQAKHVQMQQILILIKIFTVFIHTKCRAFQTIRLRTTRQNQKKKTIRVTYQNL